MNLNFEWNPQTASINLDKHDVSFEEAQTVFQEPLASLLDDQWH